MVVKLTLYVSHLDVRTDAAVNMCMIRLQRSFVISGSEIIILASIVEPSDPNGGEIIASFVKKNSGLNETNTLG